MKCREVFGISYTSAIYPLSRNGKNVSFLYLNSFRVFTWIAYTSDKVLPSKKSSWWKKSLYKLSYCNVNAEQC